jgi:hypothetical protein
MDFAVTVSSGEWEDRHERWLAVYDDLTAALDHARAASLAAEAEEPGEDGNWNDGSYRVVCVSRRRTIPDNLAPWARGERLPPERPSRAQEEGGDWTVAVPGRGVARFSGDISRGLAAAFMLGLPNARAREHDLRHAEELGCLGSFSETGGNAFEFTWEYGPMRGRAGVSASGPDAEALLAKAVEAVRRAGAVGLARAARQAARLADAA